MDYNEYKPRGGWMAYEKRQRAVETLKKIGFVALLLGAYAIVGTLEGA